MLDDGTYTATLDRFEDAPGTELAVLVVERDGDPVEQLDLPVDVLPEASRSVDSVFTLVRTAEQFELTYRADETARRAASAQARFDRLAQRPPTGSESDERGG